MTVRVEGLNEFRRAVTTAQGKTATAELANELKQAAEPVRASAQSKISRFRQVGDARVYRRGFRIDVAQSARTVTGRRGDFGALQMRVGFRPALRENEARIEQDVERWLRAAIASSGL